MTFGISATGLVCSHGSKLDEVLPRAKLPKCALPPELRAKLGLDKDRPVRETGTYFKSGFGIVEQKGAHTTEYSAGNQRNFLRRGTGVPMSVRMAGTSKPVSASGKARTFKYLGKNGDSPDGRKRHMSQDVTQPEEELRRKESNWH